jgi:hypothetical protein
MKTVKLNVTTHKGREKIYAKFILNPKIIIYLNELYIFLGDNN